MVRIWRALTGFDGATWRGRLTPVGYVGVYLTLLWMSPTVSSEAASVVLEGMRVGLTVAAVSVKGPRYLAFAFLVAGAAQLAAGNPPTGWLGPRLAAAVAAALLGARLLRWLSRRLESRMAYLQGLLVVAALLTLGLYGAVLSTGGAVSLPMAVASALGILVPIPGTVDAMAERWPSRRPRTLAMTVLCGAFLTVANAFILLAELPEAQLVAIAVPMGLVIWAAARGGLAPVSAALLNVTLFASVGLQDAAFLHRGELLSSMALLWSFAAISFLLGAHGDDLRRARTALEEREAVVRSVFDGSPILMGIVECSEDDVLHVRANRAMSRALGLEPGALDGRWSRTLGYSREHSRSWIEHCQESERTGEPGRFEYELEGAGGSKRWRSATVCHLGSGDEGRERFAYFIEDVTDRVRRADERDRFFSVSLDLLSIADAGAVLRRVNPAFEVMLGWTPSELEGAPLTRFLHPDDVLATAAELDRLGDDVARVTMTNRFRSKDGSYRWLLWAGATVPGESWIYLAAKDVTAQKETEESLRRAKEQAESAARAKMQFLANMSHELRTPVNGIVGFVELALETELDAIARDYLERCRASCDALLAVVNDVLDFSKIDAGALELHSIGFDPRELVRDVVRIVEVRAGEKGLRVETLFDPELPARLLGDSGRLRQVLLNLVANAVKFTESGWVRVTVRLVELDEGRAIVRFEVADTGVGIPASKLEAIFQPFAQADESTTRRFGGTGLGLAIASQLVDAMGGRLSLESELGRGSLFHFTVSLGVDRSARCVEPAEPEPSRAPGPLRVLLAEDHPVNRLVATRLLESLGHSVETVAEGGEAVRRFGEGQFDLLLMDVQMPEMDGLEAARTIRSIEKKLKLRPVPIIALTALATDDDRNACIEAGMDGYLAKPIRRASLIEAIASATESRPSGANVEEAPEPTPR